MTALVTLLKRAEKLLTDHSPVIMTGIGVSGTLLTAALTGKASFKAAEIIRQKEIFHQYDDYTVPFGTKEKFELTWKLYIPAAGTAALTIAAIIMANRIGTRRTAAMAALYSLSDKAFTEYKEKVIDKIGANKEQSFRDEIAQDQVNKNPVSTREVIITGGGEVLCHDQMTGRYFKSSMEELKQAENKLNYEILHDNYVSLSYFYDLIGLPSTTFSDDVGWNSDKILELKISTVLSEDNQPCLSIAFNYEPIRNYNRLN
jgi:hypothetical protein